MCVGVQKVTSKSLPCCEILGLGMPLILCREEKFAKVDAGSSTLNVAASVDEGEAFPSERVPNMVEAEINPRFRKASSSTYYI